MSDPERLSVTRADLESAHAAGVLPLDAVAPLWQHLKLRSGAQPAPAHEAPRFSFTHILYYLGGMLAIGAATLFMNEGFQRLGPWALAAICLVYGGACVWAARWLDGRGLSIPAGLVATLAVCLVPLATWSVQHALGLWPEGGPERFAQVHTRIDWRWATLEFVTLAAAAVALWALRHPFLMMPVAVTLWYLSMDLARLVVQPEEHESWTFYRDFSMWFGLAMWLLGLWVDARSKGRGGSRRDYAFWLYLLGMLTFWGALSSRSSDSELDKLAYGLLNVGFVFVGALLGRRIFAVCGGLGIAGYLGHLSFRLFKDSLVFPVALTLIGFAVIAAGVWWQRHEPTIQAALRRRLPPALHGWLPVTHE